jgi:hypothetical protein
VPIKITENNHATDEMRDLEGGGLLNRYTAPASIKLPL